MPRSNASFLGQLLGTSQKITASALDDSVLAGLSGGGVDSAQVALIASALDASLSGGVDSAQVALIASALDAGLSGGGGGFLSTYAYDGQLNTNTGSVREYIHTVSTLGYADLYLSVASSGADVIISINKNGTSITTLTLPAGQTSSLNNTINESFIQSDYITVDINQIGTTAPGEDLVVNLVFS